MTLLIIGAGGHGHAAAEVAQACGYDKIDRLDDTPGEGVIGSIEGLDLWMDEYDCYFVGIGSNVESMVMDPNSCYSYYKVK